MLQQQTQPEEEINHRFVQREPVPQQPIYGAVLQTELSEENTEENTGENTGKNVEGNGTEISQREMEAQGLNDRHDRRAESKNAYAERLMETVQKEAQKYAKQQAVMRLVVIVYVAVMMLLFLSFIVEGVKSGHWDMGSLGNYWTIFSCLSLGVTATAKHREAASELASIDDIRAVGPMAASLIIDQKETRALVQGALIRLLPRLTATDSALLTSSQRERLNDVLSKLATRVADSQREELCVAILKAYQQVGDESALPAVERLANNAGEVPLPSEVVVAAQECLPFLQHRAEEQRNRHTLLRGSYVAEASPDTLLRPAQEVTQDPHQLLRAAGVDTMSGQSL